MPSKGPSKAPYKAPYVTYAIPKLESASVCHEIISNASTSV